MAIIISAIIGGGIFVLISNCLINLISFGEAQGLELFHLLHLTNYFTGWLSGVFGLYIGCVSCFSEVEVWINGAFVRQKFSTCGSNQNVGGSKLPPGIATIPWKTFSLKKIVEPQFWQKI